MGGGAGGAVGAVSGGAGGVGGVPVTHRPASPSTSFFQIGADALRASMTSRPPAKASPRCGALTATTTDGSESGTAPTRCSTAAAQSPWRATAASAIARMASRAMRLVGLVLEAVDLAGHPLEGHDRAGPRVAHPRGHRVERQRGVAQGDVDGAAPGAAAHRRQQRELVAGRQPLGGRRVLAVHGEDERQVAGQVADGGQGVGDAGAVGQVELEHVAPGALAQHGEEADADAHRAGGYPGRAPRPRPWPTRRRGWRQERGCSTSRGSLERMHDVMTLQREVGPEVTRLAVGGEVDLAGGRELRDAMEQAALDRAAGVELDLREVSFLDSSGLAAVLGGARVLDAHGCALRTESPHGSEARLVIEMAGVGKLLGLTARGPLSAAGHRLRPDAGPGR